MGFSLNASGIYFNLGGLVLEFQFVAVALLVLFICAIAAVAAVINFRVFKAKPTADVEKVPLKDHFFALVISVATCLALSFGVYIYLIISCGALSEVRGPAVISAPIILVGDPFTLAFSSVIFASYSTFFAFISLWLLNRMKVGRGKWLMVALAVSAMPLWSLSGVFDYDHSVDFQTYMVMVLMQSMLYTIPCLVGGLTATFVLRHRNLKRKLKSAAVAC